MLEMRGLPIIHIHKRNSVTSFEVIVGRNGRKESSVYLFLVDGILIDSGPQIMDEEIKTILREQNFNRVVLTHSHEDHSGLTPWVQKNLNIPIYVHPNGIRICEQKNPYPLYRQKTWGTREGFKTLPLGETITSNSHKWEVIYTPGHADDHVCLYHAETGTMFTGDLFVSPKTKVIMKSESIPVIMDSIRKLLTYPFDSLFCSHCGFIQDGRRMLERKLTYLEQIYKEVEKMHKNGLSIQAIQHRLFPKKYTIEEYSSGEWQSLHIVTSIINHIKQ